MPKLINDKIVRIMTTEVHSTPIIFVPQDWHKSLEPCRLTQVITLTIPKAFDKIWHSAHSNFNPIHATLLLMPIFPKTLYLIPTWYSFSVFEFFLLNCHLHPQLCWWHSPAYTRQPPTTELYHLRAFFSNFLYCKISNKSWIGVKNSSNIKCR